MELEVLFEIQESKRAIKLSTDLVNRVEEIRCIKADRSCNLHETWSGSGRNNLIKYLSFYLIPLLSAPLPSISSNTSSNTHLTAVDGPSSFGTNVSYEYFFGYYKCCVAKITLHPVMLVCMHNIHVN